MEDSKFLKEPAKWLQKIRRVERLNRERREETIRYKKAYAGNFSYTKDSHVGKYTMRANYIYYFVETIMPSLFSGEPKIRAKPKKDPQLAQAAKLLEYNTNYWARELDAKDELKDCLFDSFFGPAAAYTGWEYETKKVMRKQPKLGDDGIPSINENGEIDLEDAEVEVTVKDRPKIKWLDFWEEVRVDPDVKRTRHARWIAIRVTIPYDEFCEMSNIKPEYLSGSRKIKPTMRPEDLVKENYYTEEREDYKSDPEWVSYWEVWDRQKMERKFVHEQVPDDFINEDISWPFEMQFKDDPFPITFLHAKQDPFSNLSFSEFKAFEDHIWERVRLRSVQAGIVRRFAPKYIYAKGAGTKEQLKKLLSSDILSANELNDPTKLMMAPTPELPAAFLQWDTVCEQDLGNISGLSEFQRDKLANTATEANIAQGRSDVRKDARNNIFEEFVTTVLGKVAMLCQQLQNEETTMIVDGGDLAQSAQQVFSITKDQIQGEYDFDMIPGTMQHVNETLELQELLKFYQMAAQDPEVNHRYFIEQIADYMGLDIKMALLNDQQKAQRAQAAAQQVQQQAAMQADAESKKDRIKFGPIDVSKIENPVERMRIIEAAMAENNVNSLSPGPAAAAQAQMAQLPPGGPSPRPGQMPMPGNVGMPQPQGQQRPIIPMNASKDIAGHPNPAVAVHPSSMLGKR